MTHANTAEQQGTCSLEVYISLCPWKIDRGALSNEPVPPVPTMPEDVGYKADELLRVNMPLSAVALPLFASRLILLMCFARTLQLPTHPFDSKALPRQYKENSSFVKESPGSHLARRLLWWHIYSTAMLNVGFLWVFPSAFLEHAYLWGRNEKKVF